MKPKEKRRFLRLKKWYKSLGHQELRTIVNEIRRKESNLPSTVRAFIKGQLPQMF